MFLHVITTPLIQRQDVTLIKRDIYDMNTTLRYDVVIM